MRHIFAIVAALLAVYPLAAAEEQPVAADFFVAPSGSDTNDGTRKKPFATLARAREAVRKRIAAGLESDVTVIIRQGTYELAEPLVLGPEDSGSEQYAITYAAYPGEKALISGGRRITGWKRREGEIWTASVAGVKERKWYFRNLFVNGRRAVRARTPNRDDQPNCWQLQGVELSEGLKRHTLTLSPGLLGSWQSTADIEVMIAGNWAINRKELESIDARAGVVVLAPPHRRGPKYIFPSPGRWCYFENARELLDQPGEWYLDRQTGVLSYCPLPDEDMTRADVVAPVLGRLLEVTGTPERPVRNLHFKGIRFEHTDWKLPSGGYMGIQACHFGQHEHPGRRWNHIPAAVCFTHVERSSVEDGAIARLGGCGIELADGCRENVIQGNHIFNISGNGVMVSGPKSDTEVPKNNRISNNHVHTCGLEYYGAVGIWVGFAQGAVISHNLVHDLPYTGISVGWQWNPEPTPCKENLVECNHVYDVMNRLCDGGCIYTLGFQPGTVIHGNHLHEVHRSPLAQGAPNNGMFIDQGSKGYRFQQNVIYNTSAQLVRFNQCKRDWHTWQDNYFGEASEVKEAGKEIIGRAGLEAPYRERLIGETE